MCYMPVCVYIYRYNTCTRLSRVARIIKEGGNESKYSVRPHKPIYFSCYLIIHKRVNSIQKYGVLSNLNNSIIGLLSLLLFY